MIKGKLKLHQVLKADYEAAQKRGVSAERLGVANDRTGGWAYAVMAGEINPTFEHVMRWAEETGGASLIRYIAARLGFIPVPVQDGTLNIAELGETIERFGQFVQTHAEAEADFQITTEELNAIEADYSGLTIALAGLMEDVRACHKRDGRAHSLREAF